MVKQELRRERELIEINLFVRAQLKQFTGQQFEEVNVSVRALYYDRI